MAPGRNTLRKQQHPGPGALVAHKVQADQNRPRRVAKARGVLVVMNGLIHAARDVAKTDNQRVDICYSPVGADATAIRAFAAALGQGCDKVRRTASAQPASRARRVSASIAGRNCVSGAQVAANPA